MTNHQEAHFPLFQLLYKDMTWEYRLGGQGPVTLVLFPGVIGGLDLLDRHFEAFSDQFRVLAVAIPPVSKIETFCEGLHQILQHEGVKRMVLVGSSFGGCLAQAYFFRHPRKVEKLVLSDTDIPNRHRGNINWLIRLGIRWTPFFVTRPLFTAKFNNLFNHPVPADKVPVVEASREKIKLWMKAHFTKAMFMSRMDLSIDFDSRERLRLEALDNWKGKVLVTGSDDDPMQGEGEPIQDIYPEAQYHGFNGGGHLSQLIFFEEYVELILRFIRSGQTMPEKSPS